jgi:serine/threonine-protein kinase
MGSQPNGPTREERLQQAAAAYRTAAEGGWAPALEDFLARYPDLADELTPLLGGRQGPGQRTVTLPPASPAPAETQQASPALPPDKPETVVAPGAAPAGHGSVRTGLFGAYELLGEIARGGMGVVYRARQVGLNRVVALKMILGGGLASPADVQRFRMEAEAAANLDHPNVVPIYEVGEIQGQHYFTMTLIDGGGLARQVPRYQQDPGRPPGWQPRPHGPCTTPTSTASCTAT